MTAVAIAGVCEQSRFGALPRERVLIVNSHPELRVGIVTVLARSRFDVVACETAAEGLALLRAAPRYALVVDYRLADMSGLEFVDACGALGLSPTTVMTTNDPGITAAVDALRAGISDFLPAPFDDRLAQALRRALRERAGSQLPPGAA